MSFTNVPKKFLISACKFPTKGNEEEKKNFGLRLRSLIHPFILYNFFSFLFINAHLLTLVESDTESFDKDEAY